MGGSFFSFLLISYFFLLLYIIHSIHFYPRILRPPLPIQVISILSIPFCFANKQTISYFTHYIFFHIVCFLFCFCFFVFNILITLNMKKSNLTVVTPFPTRSFLQ